MTSVGEAELLAAVAADPADVAARMVYADWLEQAGDWRCRFIRQHLRVAPLAPDHPERRPGEQELSRERAGLEPDSLAVIEPERHHHYVGDDQRGCDCFVVKDGRGEEPRRWSEVELHREPQDTGCEGWQRLLE